MRRIHEALESVEIYSPAEERFNRRRRTIGLVAAPVVFLLVLAWPLPALGAPAHRLAAVFATVIVLWVTEALPIAITALLGPTLAVVLQVAPAREAFAPFADPIIFLFMGSFMLAEAMFVHGVDRRVAFTALSLQWVGRSPTRLLVVFGGITAVLSMWISNTATTAMMFPIGVSIVQHLRASQPEARRDIDRFALALMLAAAFASSIGGVGTPVGSPPNLIGIGVLERTAGLSVSFFRWMLVGVPTVAALYVGLVVLLRLTCLRGHHLRLESGAVAASELGRLPPVSRGERNVLVAFGVTVSLWLAPGVLAVIGLGDSPIARAFNAAVPEAVAAVLGAVLLFVLPVDWQARRFTLTWEQAARIDWAVILLFGGGLSLGSLAFNTGLAAAMGQGLQHWVPVHQPVVLTAIFTGLAIALTEVTSNTAAANLTVPIAVAVAEAAGIRPLEPALGATLGCSMAFMLPISTPPNAIIYSSGYVPITAMVRYGFVLDLVGFAAIVALVSVLGPLLIP
jgi:sodium-dependent dicarboxylate transporter 2/3/5